MRKVIAGIMLGGHRAELNEWGNSKYWHFEFDLFNTNHDFTEEFSNKFVKEYRQYLRDKFFKNSKRSVYFGRIKTHLAVTILKKDRELWVDKILTDVKNPSNYAMLSLK